ncbi:MAG: DUF2062 domain-containing protein [Pseudomonadota bacterium]
MLFRRRSTPSWFETARLWLWPRRSFARSTQYVLKRIKRVNASPRAIAMGVACGAFVSFTPLLGLHFLTAFALAWLFGGNLIAAALGTFVGNPITFPFIWAFTYRVGQVMLGSPVNVNEQPPIVELEKPSGLTIEGLGGFFEAAWPIMKPMLVGSVPLGLTAAAGMFVVTYWTVVGYSSARRARFKTKRRLPRDSMAAAEAGEDR